MSRQPCPALIAQGHLCVCEKAVVCYDVIAVGTVAVTATAAAASGVAHAGVSIVCVHLELGASMHVHVPPPVLVSPCILSTGSPPSVHPERPPPTEKDQARLLESAATQLTQAEHALESLIREAGAGAGGTMQIAQVASPSRRRDGREGGRRQQRQPHQQQQQMQPHQQQMQQMQPHQQQLNPVPFPGLQPFNNSFANTSQGSIHYGGGGGGGWQTGGGDPNASMGDDSQAGFGDMPGERSPSVMLQNGAFRSLGGRRLLLIQVLIQQNKDATHTTCRSMMYRGHMSLCVGVRMSVCGCGFGALGHQRTSVQSLWTAM